MRCFKPIYESLSFYLLAWLFLGTVISQPLHGSYPPYSFVTELAARVSEEEAATAMLFNNTADNTSAIAAVASRAETIEAEMSTQADSVRDRLRQSEGEAEAALERTAAALQKRVAALEGVTGEEALTLWMDARIRAVAPSDASTTAAAAGGAGGAAGFSGGSGRGDVPSPAFAASLHSLEEQVMQLQLRVARGGQAGADAAAPSSSSNFPGGKDGFSGATDSTGSELTDIKLAQVSSQLQRAQERISALEAYTGQLQEQVSAVAAAATGTSSYIPAAAASRASPSRGDLSSGGGDAQALRPWVEQQLKGLQAEQAKLSSGLRKDVDKQAAAIKAVVVEAKAEAATRCVDHMVLISRCVVCASLSSSERGSHVGVLSNMLGAHHRHDWLFLDSSRPL